MEQQRQMEIRQFLQQEYGNAIFFEQKVVSFNPINMADQLVNGIDVEVESVSDKKLFEHNRKLIKDILCLDYDKLPNKIKSKYASKAEFNHQSYTHLERLFADESYMEIEIEFGRKPIHLACANGRLDIVKLLISRNCDIDAEDRDSWRPIHWACQHGQIDVVKLLISKNCYLHGSTNDEEDKPIHLAIIAKSIEIVKLLYAHNCDLEAPGQLKITPLHRACSHGTTDIVEFLLSENCNIEAVDECARRPIHVACFRDTPIDIINLLISNGCDIEAEDSDINRPIHIAAGYGRIDIVKLLMQKQCQFDEKNIDDESPIELACKYDSKDVVEFLLAKYIDTGRPYKEETLVDMACYMNSIKVMKFLLSINCNIESENASGLRPIHTACQYKHINIVRLLLRQNCDIEAKSSSGKKPIHYVISRKKHFSRKFSTCVPIIKLLLSKNCNIEAEDNDGNRPIHLALSNKLKNVTQLLLSINCEIEAQNLEGKRPIHIAVAQNDISFVKLLLSKGCNIDVQDMNGNTPISLAIELQNRDIIDLLLSNNCSLNNGHQKKQNESFLWLISNDRGKFVQPSSSISLSGMQCFIFECYSKHAETFEKYFDDTIYEMNDIKTKKIIARIFKFMRKFVSLKPTAFQNNAGFMGNEIKLHKQSINYKICSVCFSNGIDRINECGHLFCKSCLKIMKECSICRKKIAKVQYVIQL